MQRTCNYLIYTCSGHHCCCRLDANCRKHHYVIPMILSHYPLINDRREREREREYEPVCYVSSCGCGWLHPTCVGDLFFFPFSCRRRCRWIIDCGACCHCNWNDGCWLVGWLSCCRLVAVDCGCATNHIAYNSLHLVPTIGQLTYLVLKAHYLAICIP